MSKTNRPRAYTVDYRVTVRCYGRTAEEAAEHARSLFALASVEMEVYASDHRDSPEDYAQAAAYPIAWHPVGTARRAIAHDADVPE